MDDSDQFDEDPRNSPRGRSVPSSNSHSRRDLQRDNRSESNASMNSNEGSAENSINTSHRASKARLSVRDRARKSLAASPRGGAGSSSSGFNTGENSGSEMTEISDRRKALQQKRQRGLSQVAGLRARDKNETINDHGEAARRNNTPSPKPEGDDAHGSGGHGKGYNDNENDNWDDDYDVTTTDYPVHVFPLDFYPPSFLDTSSGKRVLLAEHVIQPLLYSDGAHGIACFDCGECECLDAVGGMCCGPACIALFAGVSECGNMGVGCVNWALDKILGARVVTEPGLISQCLDGCASILPTEACGLGVCMEEVQACAVSAGECANSATGGCAGSVGECVTGCTTSITECGATCSANITNCGTCLQTTANDTITCLQSSYQAIRNGIPSCNQHQVIYHELQTCYRQLTSCFR